MGSKVNKFGLIDFISSENAVTKLEAKNAVEMVIDAVIKILGHGNTIKLVEFGKFSTKRMTPRKSHNPCTGKMMVIPVYNSVIFKAGKKLKAACNEEFKRFKSDR